MAGALLREFIDQVLDLRGSGAACNAITRLLAAPASHMTAIASDMLKEQAYG